jgi:competence protein ComEC
MQLLVKFRKSPFARLLIFYMAGILSAKFFVHYNGLNLLLTGALLFFIIVLLIAISRHPGYNTDWLSGLISGVILFIAGYINMDIHLQSGTRYEETAVIKQTFLMEVSDPPEIRMRSLKTTANIVGTLTDGLWKKDRQKIMVYLEKDSASLKLMPGDRLLVKTRLYGVTPPKNPGEFDYRKYLAARRIYNQAYLRSGLWKTSGKSEQRSVRMLSFLMQKQLLQAYQKIGLDNTLYSILSALTLGYKNDLEAHTKQVFSAAGVMHVMALSGFNVAVIAMVMSYLLIFSDRSFAGRIFKTVVIILVIWLFAFVTGLSPSVTRAAIMISFVMTGKLLHRQINTYNILFASAFLLLTLSPALVSDISFQLSFAAVLGIIIFQPVIVRLLTFKNFLGDKTWQLFTVSCAAQLSTLPLTLYYFHQFPVYFWLTNLYVVPLVSVIICVACLFLLVSAINPLVLLIGKLLAVLLGALYKSVSFIELLPFSLIENIRINGIQTVILIAFIIFLGSFSLYRKIGFLWAALSLFIIFQLGNTLHYSAIRNQKVIMVGNLKGISAINLISGSEGILISDSTLFPENPQIRYAFGNFWTKMGVANHMRFIKFGHEFPGNVDMGNASFDKFPRPGNNLLFEFSGKHIIVLKNNNLSRLYADNPHKTDLVIVTGSMKPDLDAITLLFNPELLIIDSSVRYYQVTQWIKSCQQTGMKYWNVSQQGAYLLKIR